MNDPLININQIQEEAKAEIKEEQPWLLTYADMMTLLFAFFVLLFSMSSPDPVKMSQMQDAMDESTSLKSANEIKEEFEQIIDVLNLNESTNIVSDPRGVSMRQMAERLNMARSTLGEHLHNAEATIMKWLVENG